MNWTPFLNADERVEWEARPAPRCFTFRHWKHALFGLFFLVICVIWLILGTQVAAEFDKAWLGLLPIPFVAIGCYLAFSPLLLARLEWEQVYYALTEQRLITLRGIRKQQVVAVRRADILYFQMKKQGQELATLKVHARPEDPVIFLHCVEHPLTLVERLEKVVEQNIEQAKQNGTLPKHCH